jgi:transmembrane sensor
MSNFDTNNPSNPDDKLAREYGELLAGDDIRGLDGDVFYKILSSAKTYYRVKENAVNVEAQDEVWGKISEMMGSVATPSPSVHILRSVWVGYAIAAVLVLSIATLLWYQTKELPVNLIVRTTDSIQSVTLPDGTSITLSTNSSLSYVENSEFNVSVRLDGEAYFDVRSNPYRVFSVQTYNSKVVVVGTRFSVQSNNAASTVHLVEGSVIFEGDKSSVPISLQSGQSSSVFNDGLPTEPKEFNPDEVLNWARVQLLIDGMTLKSVISELSTRYDVQITVPQNLLNEELGGTLYIGSVNQAMIDLGLVLGGNFDRDQLGNYSFNQDP